MAIALLAPLRPRLDLPEDTLDTDGPADLEGEASLLLAHPDRLVTEVALAHDRGDVRYGQLADLHPDKDRLVVLQRRRPLV